MTPATSGNDEWYRLSRFRIDLNQRIRYMNKLPAIVLQKGRKVMKVNIETNFTAWPSATTCVYVCACVCVFVCLFVWTHI